MCRACDWPRMILRVSVSRTRLAVPLRVLSFGMIDSLLLLIRRRRVRLYARTATRFMSLRTEDYEDLVPLHPESCFNFADVREIVFESFQNARAELTVCHF